MTSGWCRRCGGLTWHPGGGRRRALCESCRGDRPFYGGDFVAARARWAKLVEQGQAICMATVCLEGDRRIAPGSEWDAGHGERGELRGPEHRRCNQRAGSLK